MPFRQTPDQHRIAADVTVHDAVDQMVRQFADELAFLRELVQNGLDADATALDVLLDHHEVDGAPVLEISVRDDGCGMDQAAMERCLLVLFRSSKEGDASRIGKFGVGFFSVFAARPDLVTVESGTDPKRPAVRLKLRPDFTWEMETAEPRRGTSVRVRVPLGERSADALAARCVARLKHWCPHIRVELTARFHGLPGRDAPVRIDAPHAIDALVQVRAKKGEALTLVGLSESPSRRYLNRGLLLQEEHGASDPEERGLAWLVDAPDLHHTISRDAVVRDAALAARLKSLQALVQGPLRDAAVQAWNAAAERCAAARAEGRFDLEAGDTLGRLARALLQGPLEVSAKALRWPLAEPVVDGDTRVLTRNLARGFFRAARFYSAPGASPLSAAVAAKGGIVFDLAPCGDEAADAAVTALRASIEPEIAPCARAWVLLRGLRPAEAEPHARALVDAMVPLVTAARVGGVMLCDAEGSGADRLWYCVQGGHDVVRGEGIASIADDAPFTFRSLGLLLLRASHRDTAAALAAAKRDPRFAALALLRLALLRAGALSADVDASIFAQHAKEVAR